MKHLYTTLLFFFISLLITAQTVELTAFGPSFNNPVEMVNAGDSRLFVVEKAGVIKILNSDGTVNSTPFLDISSLVGSGGERGLLGLAFPPDYTTTGRFYVNYTDDSSTQTPNTIVARYTVSANPDVANTTGTTLLTIPQPYSNHNGGKLTFSPNDGYLYIALGDGGSGGDPQNLAQNLNTLLGKLLRIDVSGSAYTNPSDNPYITGGGLPEIYAYGLRNPWKTSFDKTTGDLWIADVGQSSYEEINRVSGSGNPGDNYGWKCYEGAHPFDTTGCPPISATVQPVSEYVYGNNGSVFRCSITGGYVYRGNQYPSFAGKYFFADYCSGEIGILTGSGNNWTMSMNLANINSSWVSFGEDNNGELYIISQNGSIYKLTDPLLSVDEDSLNSFSLFPNPAKDNVTLKFATDDSFIESIEITNIQGQIVKKIAPETSETLTISTETFSNGIYLVKINTFTGQQLVKKLVIY
ncbi:PQQ-dependent sugar dehydrogenase [Lacinutrix chionoecetis]